uniref:Amino acid transporter transmembrane domain-containing protein n=1 Tax=Glossina austeni TaxID=7395 RepID=A0A1A9UXS3_GLOAU
MDGQNYDAHNHRDDGSDKLRYILQIVKVHVINYSIFQRNTFPSYSAALWHLMKFIWSTGMLIVPYAFQNIGWLMAFGVLIVMIALTTIGLHVMFNSIYALCCRHRVPYLPIHAALQQSINEGPLRLRSFNCMYILYSALVVMITLICFNVSNINDKYFVNDLIKYPKFMGIILFTCCPIGVFLNVEEDMKEPESFVQMYSCWQLNVSALLRCLDIIAALTDCLPLNF